MQKYKIIVIIIFLISLYSFSYANAKKVDLPLLGKVIYLDPGHGGKDPGAIYSGIYEKDINLEITKKLEKQLFKLGAIVYLTRYGDYDLSVNHTNNIKRSDLSRRSNIINKAKPDLFLSIHLNAESTGKYKGPQVFYTDYNNENKQLAILYQNTFKNQFGSKRLYKKDNKLYLLKRIKTPGVLIEVGFLSNSSERYLLKQNTYQNKIINAIVNTTVNYFET